MLSGLSSVISELLHKTKVSAQGILGYRTFGSPSIGLRGKSEDVLAGTGGLRAGCDALEVETPTSQISRSSTAVVEHALERRVRDAILDGPQEKTSRSLIRSSWLRSTTSREAVVFANALEPIDTTPFPAKDRPLVPQIPEAAGVLRRFLHRISRHARFVVRRWYGDRGATDSDLKQRVPEGLAQARAGAEQEAGKSVGPKRCAISLEAWLTIAESLVGDSEWPR